MTQTVLANGSTYLVQRTAINSNFTELYASLATTQSVANAAATATALAAEAATARAAEAAAQATANAAIPAAQKGAASGVATLDGSTKIPTAQLPNPTSTTLGGVQSAAAVAHQFVTGISTSGVPSLAQPAASDVTGLAASATTDATNATNIGTGTLPAGRLPALTGDVTSSAGSAATTLNAAASALTQQSTNAQSGTTYTLVLADAGQNVDMSNAASNTLTIPPNSSVAFAIGTLITVTQAGAGVTTIAPGAGVTIVKPSARTLAVSAQYETAQLFKTATDTWRVLVG